MSRMTIGARPRLISSKRIRSGFDISARPIATICCWPPESAVEGCVAALAEHREEAVDRVQRPRALAAELAADEEVLLDRERAGRAAALPAPARCRASRSPARAGRRSARRGSAPSRGSTRIRPTIAFMQRRLAGAVGADQRQHLALAEVEGDAEQRLEIAVEGVEPGDVEDRPGIAPRSPCRSRRPPATRSPPSGRPRRFSCRNRSRSAGRPRRAAHARRARSRRS